MRHEYSDRKIRVHLRLPTGTDTHGYREGAPLYPPETKAILEGGALLGVDYVAKKFVDGIANQKKTIAVGGSARFLLLMHRYCPVLWDWYARHKIRVARKRLGELEEHEELDRMNSEHTESSGE